MNLLTLIFGLLTHNSISSSEACGFDCWLKSLVIHAPPITIDIPVIGGTVNISDFTVNNIEISNLSVSYYPDDKQIDDGLLFNIDVSANCYANVNVSSLWSTNGNLTANATDIDISMAFRFTKDENGLITNISIYDDSKCSVIINDLALEIHLNGAFEQLLEIIKPLIEKALKEMAGTLVCTNFETIVKEQGSDFFSSLAELITPYLNGSIPINIPIDPEKMSDLRTSQVIDLMRYILTNLTSADGPLNLNLVFNKLSENTGVFDYQDIAKLIGLPTNLDFEIPIENSELNTTLNFTLKDVVISGLNTWTDFTIIEPISPFVLDTHTGLGQFGINVSFLINVSLDGIIETGGTDLSETASLYFYMENNTLDLQFQIAHENNVGINYTHAQCMDLDCLISLGSPEGTGVRMLELNTTLGQIGIEAASGHLEKELQESINTIIKFFIFNYKRQIPVFLNGFISMYGTTFLNNKINETFQNTECNYIPNVPYEPFNKLTSLIGLCFFIFGCLLVIILNIIVTQQKKKKLQIRHENSPTAKSTTSNTDTISLSSTTDDSSGCNPQPLLVDEAAVGKWLSFWREDEDASLMMHPRIPLWLRFVIPFLIIANIGLFISSNGSFGGSVFLKLHFGDTRRLEMPSFFDFSLINSIRDMWKAKTYALSILVAIMSCIWPYTKLIMMLIVWFVPATILSKERRQTLLKLLDELGKWSLLDSFFMVLMVVGFHFIIHFPIVDPNFIDKENVAYLWVYPAYGFLTLIGGTLFSLALSHIMCAIDRYIKNREKFSITRNDSKDKKICVFKEQNLATKIILPIFIPFQLALFIVGITCHSFSFKFVGLTGWALDLLSTPYEANYTVVELAYKFPISCEYSNSFNVRFIQIVYIITAIITPMLHIVAIAISLFVPLTKKWLNFMYVSMEYLYAWSCLDVFTLSLVVSIIQITQFTNFMVGDKCDLINMLLKKFFDDLEFIKGHEKCFEVLTVLKDGTFMLIASAVINTVSAIWVNHLTKNVLDREDEAELYVEVDDRPTLLLNSEEIPA